VDRRPGRRLVDELTNAGIDYAWDEDELYVYADDEEAADEVFDKVSAAAEEPGTTATTASPAPS
jgi:hypothetical protein